MPEPRPLNTSTSSCLLRAFLTLFINFLKEIWVGISFILMIVNTLCLRWYSGKRSTIQLAFISNASIWQNCILYLAKTPPKGKVRKLLYPCHSQYEGISCNLTYINQHEPSPLWKLMNIIN